MHIVDWTILLGTLGLIVAYGVWKTRNTDTSEGYLRGGGNDRWWGVGLSVMATQASAITFLSTPGQGYTDGMVFVQFYFGLPLAMLVIGLVFIPLYYRWKVYTAYEFIGRRFDGRTRLLAAGLFLLQRSLGAGMTIYAPSIILSKVMHWSLSWTCVFIGALVILYTTTGGAKAVGVTHKQQMAVMFLGILAAFGFTVYFLSRDLSFAESLSLAGTLDKMKIIDTSWNPSTQYTLWSGLIGGFFMQLAYFGTDQSQVQRYLGGADIRQARRGLWMNALLKVPMQFFILLTGVLVFVFYLFNMSPVHWNPANVQALENSQAGREVAGLEQVHIANQQDIRQDATHWVEAYRSGDEADRKQAQIALNASLARDRELRDRTSALLHNEFPDREPNDRDYIFLSYIMDHLPVGIVGLLLAMIFSAGMSSTSAELSALATTSTVDVIRRKRGDAQQVTAARWATVAFGLMALAFAAFFSLFENLIQAVNIIGSLFYGTILGIFLVAFFIKWVRGTAVFAAALIAQAVILYIKFSGIEIAFLWYNLIAPAIVIVLAILLQFFMRSDSGR